jgi:hypothetical protein
MFIWQIQLEPGQIRKTLLLKLVTQIGVMLNGKTLLVELLPYTELRKVNR